MKETEMENGRKIEIAGETVTLISRGSFQSGATRWNWMIDGGAAGVLEMGEVWLNSPELAVSDACKVLRSPVCRHGEAGFCPSCHDYR